MLSALCNNCVVALLVCIFLSILHQALSDCEMHNFCNGHGKCLASTSTCECFEGWGSTNDISFYKSPDCSARVCPSGRAWADVPTGSTSGKKSFNFRLVFFSLMLVFFSLMLVFFSLMLVLLPQEKRLFITLICYRASSSCCSL